MKFNKVDGAKLLNCCEKDSSRYVLGGVYLNKKGWLEASNGHILVNIPAYEIEPEAYAAIIHPDAIRAAMDSHKLLSHSHNMRVEEEYTFVETPQGDLKFKNLTGAFPRTELIKDLKPTVFITLSVKELKKITDVICNKDVDKFTIAIPVELQGDPSELEHVKMMPVIEPVVIMQDCVNKYEKEGPFAILAQANL